MSPANMAARALVRALSNGDETLQRQIMTRPDLPVITIELARLIARARELKPCGTYAAFKRHQAHGETPCSECTRAARDYWMVRKRAQTMRRHLEVAS